MEYKVYKIQEPTTKEVVYVGQTKRIKLRIAEHTKYDYPTRPAMFMGYEGEVIEEDLTYTESLTREAYWKDHYGLEKTETADRTWIRKMDKAQADDMRSMYATGNYTYRELSEIFPVTSTNSVWRIINNKTYR
jgi:hypothetical protein|tara:strand:+ start:242 stop:640 length:399 start_codon:yes stop_codon:yes gene_type:complete